MTIQESPPTHRTRAHPRAELSVLRVFTDAEGRYGNALGVFVDGGAVPAERRQEIAARLGFSETVFVDDAPTGRLRLFTPAEELPFAGHPLVGTAWLLDRLGHHPATLRPPAGEADAWLQDGLSWVRGRPEWCPPWSHVHLASSADVAAAVSAPPGHDAVQVWSYSDEAAGRVRARVFAARFGVHEDEACGSASQLLCAQLGRPLTLDHGDGSVIHVRPGPGGAVDVGGRVVLDEVRDFVL
jgi:predicted PhzF superfamily epimerase YddE/YHI9